MTTATKPQADQATANGAAENGHHHNGTGPKPDAKEKPKTMTVAEAIAKVREAEAEALAELRREAEAAVKEVEDFNGEVAKLIEDASPLDPTSLKEFGSEETIVVNITAGDGLAKLASVLNTADCRLKDMVRQAEQLGDMSDERAQEFFHQKKVVTDLTEKLDHILSFMLGRPIIGTLSVKKDPAGDPVIVECRCIRCQLRKGLEQKMRHRGVEISEIVIGGPMPPELEAMLRGEGSDKGKGGLFASLRDLFGPRG